MNIGCFTNVDGEGSKHVTINTNSRFFKLFCVYSNLLKRANVGEFHWSWILGDRTQVWTGKEKLIIVCLFSRTPLVVHGKDCTKKRATDAKLVVSFAFWLCSRCCRRRRCLSHPVLSMCVNCWESECVFSMKTLWKLTKWSESPSIKIYESSSVIVASTRTIQSCLTSSSARGRSENNAFTL